MKILEIRKLDKKVGKMTKAEKTETRICESCGVLISGDVKKCPKCGAKVGEKVKYIARPTIVGPNFIAEEIWDRKSAPKYMVYHFNENKFEEASEIDLGETDLHDRKIIYVPVENDALRKGLVLVPRTAVEADFKSLFAEADDFALSCYDPCGKDALVKLLVRVSVASWFLDRFVVDPLVEVAGAGKFVPILAIRGPSQSGKNRLAFVLRLLSYRPYFEMSTYRIPSIYRPLDLWQGTLVLDEADMPNTTEKSEFIHFLNCRAYGTPISRQDPQRAKCTHVFANFGLTILTQRRQFDDNATESRCIPFYSEATEKQLPTVETDEMLKKGVGLQDKLLFLRMELYQKVVIDKSAWLEGISDPRLNASMLPLIALSKHEPSVYEVVVETVKEVERLKVEEKSTSGDGLVVNYLWDKIKDGLFERWNSPVYYVLLKRQIIREKVDGTEHEREIKEALTTTKLAKIYRWTPSWTRKVVKGLKLAKEGLPDFVKVGGKSARVIFFEPLKLEKRLREFVVDYTPTDLLERMGLVTEVTEVTPKLHDESGGPACSEPELEGREKLVVQVQRDFRDKRDPDFLWRAVPEAEKCEMCGKAPVAYEINDIRNHQILRRYTSCFEKLQEMFAKSVWKQVGGS